MPHKHQTKIQFFAGFVWSLLNTCMTKKENQLSSKQFQINRRCETETIHTNNWLASQGFDNESFGITHIQLLQAQQQAHALLTQHSNLLTQSQCTTLETFQHQMTHKNTRIKLKPTAAFLIFNISSKINRQLFKQHRQLTQAQH